MSTFEDFMISEAAKKDEEYHTLKQAYKIALDTIVNRDKEIKQLQDKLREQDEERLKLARL